MKIVLLGPVSLSFQHGLSESLAGRFEVIPAHHWNLAECDRAFGWDLDALLMFGGYPAASELVEDVERWQSFLRNSIIEPVLIKDILGLTTVGKPALFRQTFELSMAYPAQEISFQKLLGQLQVSGNIATIKHYLKLLEGAFLLETLQKYSGSACGKKVRVPRYCRSIQRSFTRSETPGIPKAIPIGAAGSSRLPCGRGPGPCGRRTFLMAGRQIRSRFCLAAGRQTLCRGSKIRS